MTPHLAYLFLRMDGLNLLYVKQGGPGEVPETNEDGSLVETEHKHEAFQRLFESRDEADAFIAHYDSVRHWMAVPRMEPKTAEQKKAHRPELPPPRADWLTRWEAAHEKDE